MRSKRAKIYRQLKELIRELVKLNPLKIKEQKSLIRERISYLIFSGVVIVVFMLSGLWLLTVGFSGYTAAADFLDEALLTTGVVTKTIREVHHVSPGPYMASSSHTYYVSTVQFQTEQGQIAELTANNICQTRQPDSCSGQQVQVLYAFDNPQLSMIEGGVSPLDRVGLQIGVGIMALLGGVLMFQEDRV